MKYRFESLQKKAVSAVAALAVSTFFIGAAVGPAMNVNADPAFASLSSVERAA